MTATITQTGNTLLVRTPYNPGFVGALKSLIPAAGRQWDSARKVWIVGANYATALQLVVDQYYSGVIVPQAAAVTPRAETRLLDVRYVGATKDRGDTEKSAFGYSGGAWSVIIPESVLRRWFDMDAMQQSAPVHATLYQVLGATRAATQDEIKSAWRRMARQWHPDVCREPDAAAQFRRIQEAYELLSQPSKRARYDAALAMTAAIAAQQPRVAQYTPRDDGFRPPLRCGYILAEGHEQIGRFVLSNILAWEDITQDGKTLVTSWPAGAKMFEEAWA